MAQLACLLCGAETGDITVRLVEWREPIDRRRYENLPRCVRADDCWSRVTSIPEDWPVNDGRPARAPEPERPAETPPAVVPETQEDPEWLTS